MPCYSKLQSTLEFNSHFKRTPRIASAMGRPKSNTPRRKLPKSLRYPRHAKVPSDPRANLVIKKKINDKEPSGIVDDDEEEDYDDNADDESIGEKELEWSPDEIEAISSLFQGRIPQKPGNLYRERPLPLPLPHKLRPLRLPMPKRHVRMANREMVLSRSSVCTQVYKNPEFLINLAREIQSLPPEKNVSQVLNKWVNFLRKGSLSLTIRELGHMDMPERALDTFCWAKNHNHLFPDDRILASTIEILARTRGLKMPPELEKLASSASRTVIEAMVRGFIRGGNLKHALKLLRIAKNANRSLDPSVYAKMILEFGKNPDKSDLALSLLADLGEREELNLCQQDCTAVMKACVRLRQFEMVERLFTWFVESGHHPSVVMYTTLIHSRYSDQKYREAMAVVWEMENLNCLFDLPAYRVVIKLFVALNDLSRAFKYFSRLKEAGLAPTYDIYRDLIKIYATFGRLAKCNEIARELQMSGFRLDKEMETLVSSIKRDLRLGQS
ncbi:hypothetical protein Sjap_009712 [Stephania japonica]|uniref:Pentatricopeptide repeat-containing protein n=1 Tax=Stephania japonica TaxID=461633 RepID=A0AAP0J9U0_9MAGN